VDFAIGHPGFTVRDLQDALGLTYGRTNQLVEQLIAIMPRFTLSRGVVVWPVLEVRVV
jgi:hypothetical protein